MKYSVKRGVEERGRMSGWRQKRNEEKKKTGERRKVGGGRQGRRGRWRLVVVTLGSRVVT